MDDACVCTGKCYLHKEVAALRELLDPQSRHSFGSIRVCQSITHFPETKKTVALASHCVPPKNRGIQGLHRGCIWDV